jgi:alkylhydroperoxidase/carboxymuconolactone decarboxylase family protein YurZ
MDQYRECLRKLAIRDDALVAELLASEASNPRARGLDAKTHALVRLTATIASQGSSSSYQHAVDHALATGASRDEIAATLLAVVSLTGVPRAVAAAPELALALGYDVEAALEGLDP